MASLVSRRVVVAAGISALCTFGMTSQLLKRARINGGPHWIAGIDIPPPSPEPTLTPTADTKAAFDISTLDAANVVKVDTKAWYSWAVLDRGTGSVLGSSNMHENSRACSMIKAWIAADYLAQVKSPSQSRQDDIDKMIRDSDSLAADDIMDELDRYKSFNRLKAICQTADFVPGTSWSMATISAYDTCRVADTIADARVASPQWTQWLLNLMRTVRQGDWGVRAAFPGDAQKTIAIKNGWDDTDAVATFYANCLAVQDKWAMAVLTRYPTKLYNGEELGAKVAQSVAHQLLQRDELRTLFA